jgi:photosystem II stability/assembly factor-like uncharacterized protein
MLFRRFLLPVLAFTFVVLPVEAQRPARTARSHPARSASTQDHFKGIFEPVNYGKDINLTDVVFVTPEIGWVSGEHSTILKTTDGGTTWKVQLGGDPGTNEAKIGQLRFLDSTHGWAIQQEGLRLLRTADGQKWEEVNGKFPPGVPVIDYAFTSANHGILLGGNADAFYVTNDGGQQWQSVKPCEVSAAVQGLAQTTNCHFIKLQMLSPSSGLALAWWSSTQDERLVIFRTDDAGGHWSYVVPEVKDSRYADAFFTDLKHGVLVFNNDAKTCVTDDGGKSWHTLVSDSIVLKGPLRFADRQVGWVLGASPDNSDTFRVSFSTDGGEHWKMSRNIAFPGGGPRNVELKFSFPRRDRAYIIGPHGMIYRYRIVPTTYTSAHMLEGPVMPAASSSHGQR